MSPQRYVLAGGSTGRERLRILSRVLEHGTTNLMQRAGIGTGMRCLDAGCGGGDVSTLLARRVGAEGSVLGVDQDAASIEIARQEAESAGLGNLEFRVADVLGLDIADRFDAIYCRFLMTHLPDRKRALDILLDQLKPGGIAIFEDVDFSGHFSFPESPAMQEYMRLYMAANQKLGGDPYFGLQLPAFLRDGGLQDVQVSVNQPAALEGDAKLINPITLEAALDRIVEANLATVDQIEALADALYADARNPDMLVSMARVMQAWGRKPA